jgi:hypothetical protein
VALEGHLDAIGQEQGGHPLERLDPAGDADLGVWARLVADEEKWLVRHALRGARLPTAFVLLERRFTSSFAAIARAFCPRRSAVCQPASDESIPRIAVINM